MPDAPSRARRTSRVLRAVTSALLATATVVASLTGATAGVATAAATAATAAATAGAPGRLLELEVDWYGVALSPNGDSSRDKARVRFTLGERARVSVVVRRADKAGTVVRRQRLGAVSRGRHTWTWNGRLASGRVARDGAYTAVVVADPAAGDGRRVRRTTPVVVDTRFDVEWAPRAGADTVYPRTPAGADAIPLTLGSDPAEPMTALGEVVQSVRDARGRLVWSSKPFDYHRGPYIEAMPLLFHGWRDLHRRTSPLPAGTYRLRFEVRDLAGNPGGSKTVAVQVSDDPLVEASGSVVVSPTAAPAPAARRPLRRGGDDPPVIPCGVVVPSQVYAEPGAMSFRSSSTCVGRPAFAAADGGVRLAAVLPPDVAPRGLRTVRVSMRGRPTAAGETDTARLSLTPINHYSDRLPDDFVLSPAVAAESVTSTPPKATVFEAPYFDGYPRSVSWSIATVGTDSYDVADVTVHFTYLTPGRQVP